jgi:hypothetical protein
MNIARHWALNVALCAVVVLLQTRPARAAITDLRGLSGLYFHITKNTEALARCGSNETTFQNSMLLPILTYTKLRRLNDGNPYMHLVVHADELGNGKCIFEVNISVQVVVNAKLPYQSEERSQTVTVWQRSTYGRLDVIQSKIEQIVKDFATEWLQANQSR